MKRKPLIVITGAHGFTGRHACQYFVNGGMTVVPMSRTYGMRCDLTDERAVSERIRAIHPDYLLHLAGNNSVNESWKHPYRVLQTNVIGTLNLLEAVHKHARNCKTLVIGSALQYNPMTHHAPHPYALSKTLQVIISEAWGHLMGLNIVIAKPTNLMGPGDTNGICSMIGKKIVAMEKGEAEPIIELDNRKAQRDFLDVRDANRAYDLLLKKGLGGRTYEIGSGKNRSLQEVLLHFQKLTSKSFTIRFRKDSKEPPRAQMDLTSLQRLGWKPRYPFMVSLRDILDFYRNDHL